MNQCFAMVVFLFLYYYLVLTGLELAMWTTVALTSQRSICLCLSGAGLKDVTMFSNSILRQQIPCFDGL